jgi:hypothetical protein
MNTEQLALPAATMRARAVAIGAPAAPQTPAGSDLPELWGPSIFAPPAARARALVADAASAEFGATAIPIPEAAPGWAHDRGAGPDRADADGDFSWNIRPDAKAAGRRKKSASTFQGAGQRLRAILLTGALLTTFGLGWLGGATSHRIFQPPAASSPIKQRLDASARIKSRQTSDTQAPASGVRKLSSAVPIRPEPAPVALPSGLQDLPHLVPVPETRPTTIEGWTVRTVSAGTAVLEGPNGTWRVSRGDMVPGVGRVDSIVRWGTYWLVATSRGLIASE